MADNRKPYIFEQNTEIEFSEVALTEQEYEWLRKICIHISTNKRDGEYYVDEVILDTEKLAQMAFEYDILLDLASSVEVEIIRLFRQTERNTLTTAEISENINRSKSSVSRALTRLVEKDQLEKVQRGVYRI